MNEAKYVASAKAGCIRLLQNGGGHPVWPLRPKRVTWKKSENLYQICHRKQEKPMAVRAMVAKKPVVVNP